MKKEMIIFPILFILFLPLVLGSLGISPAKENVDFQPGAVLNYTFKIYADEGQTVEFYSAGEFSNLVSFDKKEITGEGFVGVTITLPESIDKPGSHIILIGARGKVDPAHGIGATEAVQAPIIVSVPYPGKYADIGLTCHSINFGESLAFGITLSSFGKEPVTGDATLEIQSENQTVNTVDLGSQNIDNQKSETFDGMAGTELLKPGDYSAVLTFDYGERVAKSICNFRVGMLFVNITNYTREITKPGIKPFDVDIESLWNSDIDKIYGTVDLLLNGSKVGSFMTPWIQLSSWKTDKLVGYLDTDALQKGRYDISVRVNYGENYTLVRGSLDVKEAENQNGFYIIISLVLLGVVAAAVVTYVLIKRREDKDGKKKKQNKK